MSKKTTLTTLTFDDEGWLIEAERCPSPNFDERPQDTAISLLVIHNISLPPRQFGGHYVQDLFMNQLDCDAHPYFDQLRNLHVSSHFFIQRDGKVVQCVSAEKRAWHAGVSEFNGKSRCNDFSIGIELEGSDFDPFMDAQYQSLILLTQVLVRQYPILDIVGHEDIAPVRKTDPGPFFDWKGFQEALSQSVVQSEQAPQLRFPFGFAKVKKNT